MLEQRYYEAIQALLTRIADSQAPAVATGAAKVADSLMQGGILHVFGSGHSAMIGKEITHRAGGLVPVNLVPDPAGGLAERVEGYGKVLFQDYKRKYGLQHGEVLIVVSTSGRNPVPIEVALEAQAEGLFAVAITSVEYSRLAPSRHSSGKRLFEVVDLVLDNCVPPGDAIVEVEPLRQRSGASSTLAGALLANMLVLRAIEEILARGGSPPILKSQNLGGADAFNRQLLAAYRGRLTF
ncbi:MAG: sugar isomerase domain-containing protein [Candidatus Bipolaricaulaceae bacterium]